MSERGCIKSQTLSLWLHILLSSHSVTMVLLVLFVALFTTALPYARGAECTCACMPHSWPSELLVNRSLDIPFKCEEEDKCRLICNSLASANLADPKGLERLCLAIGNIIYLQAHIFYKLCGEGFTFTGLKFDDYICCHNGMHVQCRQRRSPTGTATTNPKHRQDTDDYDYYDVY